MNSFSKKLLLICLVVVLVAPIFVRAATEPEVFITWQSQTYTPVDYLGKNLPTGNSWISVYVDVLKGGRFADLKNETVYWYQEDKFISGGLGLTHINIRAPEIPGQIIDLRVEVPTMGADVLKTIEIPVVSPVVALQARYPNGVMIGDKNRVDAVPYYFDVPDFRNLTYRWQVNGQDAPNAQDPYYIELSPAPNTPNNFDISLGVMVSDAGKLLQSASRNVSLMFNKR